MILFENQWAETDAVVHWQTKNESFLKYSAMLKDLGVRNHLWMLTLYDQSLIGVNPHDPNLDTETVLRIAAECKRNFFYFIREVFRSPDGDPDDPIPFQAHRGNMALYWLYWNHIEILLVQIRQTGKSFGIDVLDTSILNINGTKVKINLLTKDETLRAANLDRLRRMEFELPYYLKQRTRLDIGNSEEITVKALENSYKGHLPSNSEKGALSVGRGLTSANFRVDELAFFRFIYKSLPAALAAGTAARGIARRRGSPHGVIMATTAGKKDDRDGSYAYELMMEAAVWSEHFMDCKDEAHLREVVIKNSPGNVVRVNCTFNHRQLGFTDEWLREAIIEAKAKGDDARRDFLNHWTSGSNSSPLPTEVNNKIRESQKGDYYTEISKPFSYVVRWYVPQQQLHGVMQQSHTLSVDTSDAIGNDDIGLVLRNIRTGAITAAGNYNEINLISFAEWLCVWLEKYPSVTLIIERRSSGATILDYLLLMLPKRGIDPFKRIYNKIVQDADEKPEPFKEICTPMHARRDEIYTKYKSSFGFATSGTGETSRTALYSTTLQNAAHHTGHQVNDKVVIEQILSLEVKNGRVDHRAGKHDDLVIAWLLSYWLISSGKNLHHYGINSREIMVENRSHSQENSPVERYKRMEQDYVRNMIEKLSEELKKEKDDFVADRIEANLRSQMNRLTTDARQSYSVDELINSLKEQRKLNRRFKSAMHLN